MAKQKGIVPLPASKEIILPSPPKLKEKKLKAEFKP